MSAVSQAKSTTLVRVDFLPEPQIEVVKYAKGKRTVNERAAQVIINWWNHEKKRFDRRAIHVSRERAHQFLTHGH